MDEKRCLEKQIEIMEIDKADVQKRLIKLLNTAGQPPKIFYNYFEDFLGRLVSGRLFRSSILQEWIKILLLAIPQAVILFLLFKYVVK